MNHFSVVVRCRPSADEKAWKLEGPRLQYAGKEADSKSLAFDRVFSDASSHSEVYETIKPLVEGSLEGNNVGVVVYGLPGTGKSHTVFGTSGQSRVRQEARGIIVRCGQQLFDMLQKAEEGCGSVCRVTTTFCHVFEDGRVADLFDTKKRNLDITEDASNLLYSVPGLTKHVVTSTHDVVRLVNKGYLMRNATGCLREPVEKKPLKALTAHPLQQYRQHCSHAIFTFSVEHMGRRGDACVTVSRITVVDLSGRSIEILHSGQPCPDIGIEVLNRILTTLPLEGVLAASSLFVRSSLTKLLKPCFGGNCQTLFIASMDQSESAATATRRCLELLEQARRIKNYSKPTTISLSQSDLGRCLTEVERLKLELSRRIGVGPAVTSWEAVGDSAVKIGGALHEQLSVSCQDLLRKVAKAEAQVVRGGVALQQGPTPSQPAGKPSSGPAAMVRPQTKANGPTMKLPSTTRVPLTAAAPREQQNHPKPRPGNVQEESDTDSISSVEEDTDSLDSNEEPPDVVSGPPPPPLRGIPHINPDSGTGEGAPPSLLPPPLPRQLPAPVIVRQVNNPTRQQAASASGGPPRQGASAPGGPPRQGASAPGGPPRQGASAPGGPPRQGASAPSGPPRQGASAPGGPPRQGASAPGGPPRQVPLFLAQPLQRPKTPKFSDDSPERCSSRSPLPAPTSTGEARPLLTTAAAASWHPPEPTPPKAALLAPISPALLDPPEPTPPTAALSPPISPALLDPPVAPIFSSTPKARRTLLPALNEQPESSAASLQPSQPQPGPSTLSTPGSRQLPTFPTLSPKGPLSPLRPAGVAPSSFSHPTLAPMWSSPHSTVSHSSSSMTLTDSDSELHDEARDSFDPNIQRRQLTMLPARPSSHHTTGMVQLPVLPPIAQAALPPLSTPPARSHPPTPTFGTPSHHPNDPPSYEQASFEGSPRQQATTGGSPPDYYREPRAVRREERDDSVNMAQYVSSEEIHVAAMEGVKASVLRKLATRVGVDYRDHGGRTPLMYAVLGNQPKMCEVLLGLGAGVNTKDSSGLTPLLWATYQAKPHCMKVLLRHGSDTQSCDPEGRTAYHWAVKTPNIHCLKLLCKYANSSVINYTDREGLTPLHWAVMCDQPSHVRLLLTSTSADVGLQDREGRTALNFAVLNFSPACIKAILDCRESAVNLTDAKGRTALHYACAEGSADCVRTLLSYHSCNLHCTDSRGTTPLHWSAAANQPGLLQLLLRRGADRARKDSEDMTALDYAQQREHSECVRILRTYGLRRPPSALSIASQVSIQAMPPPTLDEFGHIPPRRPKRRFSLTSTSVSSVDRLPADGQAHSDGIPEEHGTAEPVADSSPPAEQQQSSSSSRLTRWAGARHPQQQPSRQRTRWWLLCCSGQSNIIVPVSSTHSVR